MLSGAERVGRILSRWWKVVVGEGMGYAGETPDPLFRLRRATNRLRRASRPRLRLGVEEEKIDE